MNIPSEDIINLFRAKNSEEQQKTAMKMMSQLDEKQSAQVKNIMQDEQKLRSILQSPEAQILMDRLKGFKNG